MAIQFVDVGVYIFHPTKKQSNILFIIYNLPYLQSILNAHSHFLFPTISFKGLTKNKGMKIPCQNSNPTHMISLQIGLKKVHG
jgi:hypothetical protein